MVEAGEVLTDLKFLTALSEEEGEKKLVIWDWLIPSEKNMAIRYDKWYDKWYNDWRNECTKRMVDVIEKMKSNE
jgi:hypothetical protein